MNKSLQIFLFLGIILSSMASMGQGVTTSSINGRVLEGEDQPLLGATIVAVHTPTGTKYGSVTDIEGYYRINNMRVGGPYDITITYVGKQDLALNNIFLQLGESEQINATLAESTNALDEIVIQAQRNGIFDSGKTGPETNISTREIETLPTVTRDIQDLLRKTPQAQVAEGGGITLGGVNNRYNTFYIDGAVSNDVFGLADTGTNGGQIGVNPISLDAIESFSVNLAPFDVRQSGFAGGSINAITRSGTNQWSGSAYGYYRNEDLAGKTPGGFDAAEREKLDEFTATRIGARIGGPIIENKLFFFLNYERQDEETPRFFDATAYNGDSSFADIQTLQQNLISNFGYNPGNFEDGTQTLESDTFTLRLDYNLDDLNTFTLKHNYVNGESNSPSLSNRNNINFANAGILFTSETNSTTFEWRTSNGSNLSNNLVIGYTKVNDDRDPIGKNFPRVQINDGQNSRITFGSEAFSTGNILDQELFNVTNNFEIQSGAHNITIGGSFEYFDVRNVFVRQNFGQYQFLSLSDFNTYFDADPTNDVPADAYDYSYSLLDPAGTTGDDIEAAAAAFKYSMLGFYAQDAWNMTDNFRLTYGVRFDVPFFSDGTVNDDFNTRTVALLEDAGKDLQGARVGKPIKSQIHVAPRLGFNWDVNGDNSTQLRGGIGIFTSRIPLVWPGGAYNNNGVSVGSVDERNFTGGVLFNPDPTDQPIGNGAAPGSGELGGQIDLFAPDFKLPQRLKYNIGLDQELGIWGLIASADFLYNDVINDVTYENLNNTGPRGTLNGADNRNYFGFDPVDRTYNNIYLGTNTNEGYSYNATFTLTKPVQNGFGAQVSYTYGDGEYIFEGTSSQNSSQWRNVLTVNGKNFAQLQNSQFATGHQIIANATYKLDWSENIATSFGLFYTGQNGGRYSYIYNEGRDLLGDDSRDNALIYIPANASEINLVPLVSNGQIFTAADQYAALDAYIENDEYLRTRRGQYAEANASRASWNHTIDLKILQDFSIYTGANKENKNTLQLSLDIFNVANLLNKDWGERTFVPNFGEVGLITTQRGGPNPEFTFDPSFTRNDLEVIDDGGTRSSRWQMQIGARYIFN